MAKATKPPQPSLTGIPAIDALLAAQTDFLQGQLKQSRKSILLTKKKLKQEKRQTRIENQQWQQQYDTLQASMEPDAPLPSLTMAEVQAARLQTQRDAAQRNGIRKSTLAGETGGYQPGVSSATGRKSILA